MTDPASDTFNAQAQGGNGLVASDLVNRPLAEWDAAIAGRQPDNIDTFKRNLSNTLNQKFDEVLTERSIFNITHQFDRIRDGARYPHGPEQFTDNEVVRGALEDAYEKAASDPNYGADQLRGDLETAREGVNSKIEAVVNGFRGQEAAVPLQQPEVQQSVPASRPATPGISV